MSEWRERLQVALWVLSGRAVMWRATVRREDGDVVRIRSTDPTTHLLVRQCFFDTNPDADCEARVLLGDGASLVG